MGLLTRFDVWWCEEHGYWTVPSIPHRNECPVTECGRTGWWIRFTRDPRQVPSLVTTFRLVDLDQPWVEETRYFVRSIS